MSNNIKIKRGLKAGLPNLEVGEFGLATDTNEVFIGTPTGNILVNSAGEVDLDTMSYFDYAGSIYGDKYSLLSNAWESSLAVDPEEISANSTSSTTKGKAQYPNGETEGVIIPQGVTSIGNFAFYDWNSNNQPLVIPNSVTSIGNYAFYNWTSNNQSLVIPNSVTSIGEYAFRNWTSNNQPLVIPDSITSIGSGAFWYWSSNKHPLVIPESVESIGNSAFRNWVLVPYIEIQAITPPTLANANAFNNQNNAPIYVPDASVDDYKIAPKWVDLADRIFPISDKGEIDLNEMSYFDYAGRIYGAKYNLLANAWESSLAVDPEEISEDSDLLSQRGTAQYPNGETEGVIIPHSVTSIGSYAFTSWNSNNQPLVIPNSVTSIGNNAFTYWKSNNQPLVIPDSVTSIGLFAFGYWQKNKHPLVIPESVESIGTYTFSNWEANNHPLVIPNSVTSIGSYAFRSWESNTHPLVIPESVTSIGTSAFSNWTLNNKPLVIPESVESIEDYAFYNWESVPYVEIQAITPPTLADANAFSGQSNAPIYVPDESVDDYKEATQWVDLASRIFPMSDRTGGGGGGIPEAPIDDKLYGRKNAAWSEIISGGGGGEVDLNEMSYFNYAGSIYGDKYSLLENAWESSLAVDPSEISVNSTSSSSRGKAQYSNGEVEGVIIPQSVISIGNYAFSDWSYNNQPLVIPNSVTTIGNYAFRNWTENNQPLVIPNRVTIIGAWAFSSWSSNDQPLVISDSVTTIGDYAFGAWTENNQPLTIPNSVASIGDYAFAGWISAKEFIMESETPPTITSNSFTNTNNAPFYVPDESVDDYKEATNWVDLADRIFPISDKGNTYTKGEIDLMIGDIENALDAILGV